MATIEEMMKKVMTSEAQMRLEIIKAMHEYIYDTTEEEEYYEIWCRYAVPDGADEDDFIEIANDKELFKETVKTFVSMIDVD